MTETMRHHFCLTVTGAGALAALVALDAADHETLMAMARRLSLWVAVAGLSFIALRPLRPGTGR